MAKTRWVLAAPLLLVFTVGHTAWAETAHLDAVQENAEPTPRDGPALRVGSSVGYVVFAGERVRALGATITAAWQLGRIVLEADYGHYRLRERIETAEYSGTTDIGGFNRVGVSGRLDLGGPGREWVGPNSKLLFFIEGGIGIQRGSFLTGERFQRSDQIAGFGWLLDHRLQRPLGFPSRVGWHFGWRLVRTSAPIVTHVSETACKSRLCTEQRSAYEVGLLVGSGMHLSW